MLARWVRSWGVVGLVCLVVGSGARAEILDVQGMERQMADLVNKDRAANGLPALSFDARLSAVARGHSQEMASLGYFSHQSPRTGTPTDRILAAGIVARATAENIALDRDVRQAQSRLMASPGHRTNLLSTSYDRLGIGIARSRTGQILVTQVFARVGGAVATRPEPSRPEPSRRGPTRISRRWWGW